MKTVSDGFDPAAAKQAIFEYCKKRGALAVGVANLEALERIAPAGHRPSDLMPRVRTVISLGVGRYDRNALRFPGDDAKELAAVHGQTNAIEGANTAELQMYIIDNQKGIGLHLIKPDARPSRAPWRLLRR